MTATNRQWLLKERPTGLVGPEHFTLKEGAIPEPGDNEILVRTLYFGMDPTQRGWLHQEDSYIEPVQIGDPMRASAIAQVVKSNDPDYAPGDLVAGTMSWQDYAITSNGGPIPLRKLSRDYPLTWNFSVFGITTLTAYFGVVDVLDIKEGDEVLVSGAAGATGQAACQMARLRGAKRVVGIAGGAEKCRFLTEEIGCDAAIDYKSEDVEARIRALFPNGHTAFYENVGGDILDAGLATMAQGARIAICGGISSGYNSWSVDTGPKNYLYLILKAAKMQGFLVVYYMDRFPEAIEAIAGWVKDGKLKVHETVLEGFEKAPEALQGLFTGKNLGKMIVKVADPA